MKTKLLFTFALAFLAGTFANAQSYFSASGSGAVDWTMTEYTGTNTYTLSDDMDAGRIVLYDYFFTTCFYCTVSAPELEDIYQIYGPTGSDEVAIYSLDIKPSTHTSKNLDDYVAEYGVTNPVFDVKTDYIDNYSGWFFGPYDGGGGSSYGLPHFIAVCPDGTWKSLFQDDVFPGTSTEVNADLKAFLGSACPSTPLSLVTLDKKEVVLSVYPNPTTDIINISYNSVDAVDVSIVSIVGEVVYSGKMNNKLQLDVSAFAKGVYVVNITTNDKTIQERFIVQ